VAGTVQQVRDCRPCVLVLDLNMGGESSLETIPQLRVDWPETQIVVLTMQEDPAFARAALRAGAVGYLVKDSAFDELNQAIRTVITGRPFLSSVITGSLVEDFVRQTTAEERRSNSPLHMLTAREQEVLRNLADGKRVKEVAQILEISVKTVESHRQKIMDKLEIHSTIELTRYAIREGLASI